MLIEMRGLCSDSSEMQVDTLTRSMKVLATEVAGSFHSSTYRSGKMPINIERTAPTAFSFLDHIENSNRSKERSDRPISFAQSIPGHRSTNDMDRASASRKRPAATYNHRPDMTSKKQQKQRERADSADNDSLFVSDTEADLQSNSGYAHNIPDDDFGQMLLESARDLPTSPRIQPLRQISRPPQPASPFVRQNGTNTASQATPPAYKPAIPRPSTTRRPLPARSMSHSPPTTIPAEPIEIKDESDDPKIPDYIANLPATHQVKIYIGKRNKLCFVSRTNLEKSPVLTSWILEDPNEGPFVMRPQLQKTEVLDFDAICQYLHSGEYAPLLVAKDGGEMVLDGIANGDEAEYSKQLVRAGRIYVLAQMYQVQGLDELVYKKVTGVDVKRYSLKSFVELAGLVFSDKRPVGFQVGQEVEGEGEKKDMLEEWIVGQMAHNFQEVTKSRHDQFWGVVEKTRKKMFFAKVLEEAAERYRTTGGILPDAVIELD